jgi:hypothetical protein
VIGSGKENHLNYMPKLLVKLNLRDENRADRFRFKSKKAQNSQKLAKERGINKFPVDE